MQKYRKERKPVWMEVERGAAGGHGAGLEGTPQGWSHWSQWTVRKRAPDCLLEPQCLGQEPSL